MLLDLVQVSSLILSKKQRGKREEEDKRIEKGNRRETEEKDRCLRNHNVSPPPLSFLFPSFILPPLVSFRTETETRSKVHLAFEILVLIFLCIRFCFSSEFETSFH